MARTNKYSVAEVVDALQKAHGIVKAAARILNCERRTVYRYIHRYPSVAQAHKEASEDLLDMAEQILFKKAIQEEDTTSLIFLLKTKGKSRGYVEKQEYAPTIDVESGVMVVPGILDEESWRKLAQKTDDKGEPR